MKPKMKDIVDIAALEANEANEADGKWGWWEKAPKIREYPLHGMFEKYKDQVYEELDPAINKDINSWNEIRKKIVKQKSWNKNREINIEK